MPSPIHQTETSAFTSVICDVCRKHVDRPSQFSSLAEACGDASPYESIEQHRSTIEVHKDAAGHFDCNICLDECHDPVVTQCGHLFCWPCLYYWLSLHSVSKECPVCKASVQDKIIPLYGRGKAECSMNSAAHMFPDVQIPCRPLPSRSDVSVPVTDHDGEHNHAIQYYESHTISARHAAPSANVGFFTSMLRCGMTSLHHYGGGASMLAPRQRFGNEKEFVLQWAFIFAASIAIICFIVW